MDAAGPGRRACGSDRRAHRLGAERRLARRLPERDGRGRGDAAARRGRTAGGNGAVGRLGRRGGRSLWTLAVRLVGRERLDGRPGRAAAAARRRRGGATRCAARARSRARPGAGGPQAAGEHGRLPRAAHRAGTGAGVAEPAAGRRPRHLRRRAAPGHLPRPGRACRFDPDGQTARRAGRRGEARARDPRDRQAHRRRRGVHDGRRRHAAGDRHLGGRDGRMPARPAASRREPARGDAQQRRSGLAPVCAGGGPRGRVGADLEHRADPVRRRPDRARRRVGPGGGG